MTNALISELLDAFHEWCPTMNKKIENLRKTSTKASQSSFRQPDALKLQPNESEIRDEKIIEGLKY